MLLMALHISASLTFANLFCCAGFHSLIEGILKELQWHYDVTERLHRLFLRDVMALWRNKERWDDRCWLDVHVDACLHTCSLVRPQKQWQAEVSVTGAALFEQPCLLFCGLQAVGSKAQDVKGTQRLPSCSRPPAFNGQSGGGGQLSAVGTAMLTAVLTIQNMIEAATSSCC